MYHYQKNELCVEECRVVDIVGAVGSPVNIYSYQFLKDQFTNFSKSFHKRDHLITYSMKANSNAAIIKTFINLGGGIDVVSGGELRRALLVGCDPKKIVFSGIGKTDAEIEFALKEGILQFNIESKEELYNINRIAKFLELKAPIALRVNPNVDAKTHPYISTGLKKSKFGVSYEEAHGLYVEASKMDGIEVVGVHCHIGSQLTQTAPFMEALQKIRVLIENLKKEGIEIRQVDVGGGLGIIYKDETPPSPVDYAQAVEMVFIGMDVKLILEPGRYLVGNSGMLVTKVIYNKDRDDKRFVIVDAASNDLMRPTMYDAYHKIIPVNEDSNLPQVVVDVVGPICETGDFFAHDRKIQDAKSGDLLAILSIGAYGYSMSSNYNSRPRVAEVMVNGKEFFVVKEREKLEDIVKGEHVPPFLNI